MPAANRLSGGTYFPLALPLSRHAVRATLSQGSAKI